MELEGTYILNDEDLDQILLQQNKIRIKRDGYLICNDCEVYSYKLATLFWSKELLKLYEKNSSSFKQVTGWKLINIYEAAYKEGLKDFDSLFQSTDLYGEHSESIIDGLHQHCYHTRHEKYGLNAHWFDIIGRQPYVLSKNVLVKYGFYSGILRKVKILTNDYKAAFDRFDKGRNCKICFPETGLDHRHHAIIRKYLIDAKYIPSEFNRTEIKKQFGKGREKAVDSVNELSKVYKKITAKELEIIIPHLADYPNAQKAAINDLDNLN